MENQSDLTKQIQDEGRDWLATAVLIALIVALVFAATFCHAEASRAQADPMPILLHEALWMPQVTK